MGWVLYASAPHNNPFSAKILTVCTNSLEIRALLGQLLVSIQATKMGVITLQMTVSYNKYEDMGTEFFFFLIF